MKTQFCNLNTTFENSSVLMIHTVSKNVSVIADFERRSINLLNAGKIIEKVEFDNMSLADYENYLAGISRSVETTKNPNV